MFLCNIIVYGVRIKDDKFELISGLTLDIKEFFGICLSLLGLHGFVH